MTRKQLIQMIEFYKEYEGSCITTYISEEYLELHNKPIFVLTDIDRWFKNNNIEFPRMMKFHNKSETKIYHYP